MCINFASLIKNVNKLNHFFDGDFVCKVITANKWISYLGKRTVFKRKELKLALQRFIYNFLSGATKWLHPIEQTTSRPNRLSTQGPLLILSFFNRKFQSKQSALSETINKTKLGYLDRFWVFKTSFCICKFESL